MKVLLIDQFSEFGGAQRCLFDLVVAMNKSGWQPRVALPSEGPLSQQLKEHLTPVDFIACGPYHSGRKTFSDAIRFTFDVARTWRKIAQLAAIHRSELIYVNGPRPLPAASLASRGQVPLLFHVHSHLPEPYARQLAGWSVRASNATVIASCEFLGQPLRAYVPADRFHVIYNGVAQIPFTARPFPLNHGWRIGIIGRIAPEKGQAEFLKAARIVNKELPGCTFVICGAPLFSDPAYQHSVQTLSDGLPVEFLGWRQDVDAVLSNLDLLVVPSAAIDGTTRVILEAYAAGVPVVAYPSGGIREVVDHGRTGFLTQSNDAESLGATLLDIVRTPQRLPDIAGAARKAWEEKYTVDRYCDQVLEVIRSGSARNSAAANSATSAAVPRTGE